MDRNIKICRDLAPEGRACLELEEDIAGVLCSHDHSAAPGPESNFNLLGIPVGCQRGEDHKRLYKEKMKRERLKEKLKNL